MPGAVHRLATNPHLNLTAGLILIATSAWEVVESLDDPGVGAHHGVLIYGLVQVLKILPDFLEGVKGVHESRSDEQDGGD